MVNPESQLADKTLVMLVGPTAVGKSTIMNAVAQRHPEFKRVTGFTTRDPRPNDEPGQYRYLSEVAVRHLIETGLVLQYVVNPGNGQIYGTTLEDYPGTYNMKDTLSIAVDEFKQIPFKGHQTISLTVPPDSWKQWLLQRYPEPSDERTSRLREAQSSIEWSLGQTAAHQWLVNYQGTVNDVADRLTKLAKSPDYDAPTPDEPKRMLDMIHDLLSYG